MLVDTLSKTKPIFCPASLPGSCWNSVKTGVIKRLVLFQHAVDGM